jgi:antitoxin component YwqK of YwqJK toxin-antitoxin module
MRGFKNLWILIGCIQVFGCSLLLFLFLLMEIPKLKSILNNKFYLIENLCTCSKKYLNLKSNLFIKKIITALFFLVFCINKAFPQNRPAQFPDGEIAWNKYIYNSILKDFDEIGEQKVCGTIEIKFTIDKEGNTSDIITSNMKETQLAKSYINAVKNSPKWNPHFSNGKPIESVIIQKLNYTCNTLIDGLWTEYYLNDSVKSRFYIKDGNFDSVCTKYYANGELKEVSNYKDGQLNGKWQTFFYYGYRDDSGAFFFKKDVIGGDDKYLFHGNGKLKETCFYVNGKKTGEYKKFYDNGSMAESGFYKNGLMDGEWIYYSFNGKIEKIKLYKDGVLMDN